MTVHVVEASTRIGEFVGTGFTGRMDFIVVLYSVAINGLPSNNPFRFLDNVVSVSRI
jgi:hypothetical protein